MIPRVIPFDRFDIGAYLRPGDHLIWGQACAEPTQLLQALQDQASTIPNLCAFVGASFSTTLDSDKIAPVKLTSFGALGSNRRFFKAGRLDIIPCHVGLIAAYIRQNIIRCDVALVQVSPPGPDGRHSFGLTGDYIGAACRKARIVIAEINPRVPWMFGDPGLGPDDITVAIDSDAPPITVPPGTITDIDRQIARHAQNFIDDGSTLQMGIGAAPDAILQSLTDRRDLGIHSGMIGDALIDLIDKAAVTNARKPIDTGLSITGALIGSDRLYRFAHHHRLLHLRSSDHTHDPAVLAQLPRLVSINSALEVDLGGAINAEAIGGDYIGAIGGQADYVRAGHRQGHAIIALPATTRGGQSRIVPALSGPVTTARCDADIIITEHGAADLRGQPLRERARRLIAAADPGMRADLERQAHLMGHHS